MSAATDRERESSAQAVVPVPAEAHVMNGKPLRQSVTVQNAPLGFHMRPVTTFAQLAASFECTVLVWREGRAVNGKSPWDMMSMLSPPGTELIVEAEGPDAKTALTALVAHIANLKDTDEAAESQPRG